MREGFEVRESSNAERPDPGATQTNAVEQPRRVTLALAADLAPASSGAYRFWNDEGHVLYVGKALNLRNRIRNHLQASEESSRHNLMLQRATTIDWIISPNEVEALLLEDMLIKKHRPDFNVRFRDDKRYPIIRLAIEDDYPSLSIVRRFENDGADYFGPYTSSRTMRTILRVIEQHFPLRRCNGPIGKTSRECLNFQIRKCPGVCGGHVDRATYMETVIQVRLLLSGRNDELTLQLEREMMAFSESQNFEAAAIRRDQLEAVRNVSGGRKLLLPRPVDLDVFCVEQTENKAYCDILLVRSGMVSGNLHLHLKLNHLLPIETITEHFMIHYYREHPPIPHAVISSCAPDSQDAIESLLKSICGRRVKIYSRAQGIRKKLIALARSNLRLHAQTDQRISIEVDGPRALQELLNLNEIPHRIEAIDISESQGKNVVGSVVAFLSGQPEKSKYRRYRLPPDETSSDLERIKEVLRRRLRRSSSSGWGLPDIFLIDGGKLQLKAALSVCRDSGYPDCIVISIVKIRNSRQSEGLFFKNNLEIILQPDSVATKFLDRMRDEAHRFAITYHRLIRDRATLKSSLTEIPGIGLKRRKILLDEFGSLAGIRNANLESIANLPGFGYNLATLVQNSIKMADPQERVMSTKKS